MTKRNYVAVDLGATSGRVVTGEFNGSKLSLSERHRFLNEPVKLNGTVYWDILYIFKNVVQGIKKAGEEGAVHSIGIDSWGSDFILLDKDGRMQENPMHYRDELTKGMLEKLYEIIPASDVYQKTGIQHMRLNGLYRLYAMRLNRFSAYENAKDFLMIPDALTYFLTGEKLNEHTNATTTQMVSAVTGDWAYDMLTELGINTKIFHKPVIAKDTRLKLLDDYGGGDSRLSVIGTHDTACAVAAVPSREKHFIYISSGTWSLVGTETDAPIINELSMRVNFTNEGGVMNKNRLLKNVMGMWILEELRREWEADAIPCSYPEIIAQAKGAEPYKRIIDPDKAEFMDMGGMSGKINANLRASGQPEARSVGEFARCLFDSLALCYRNVISQIRELTGKEYQTIHIVGGGSKNSFLNQIIADVCGMQVAAGPVEATAAGNIMTQAYVCGDISGLAELRAVLAESFTVEVFEPRNDPQVPEAYGKFQNIFRMNKETEK